MESATWVEIRREGGVEVVNSDGTVAFSFGPSGQFWASAYFYGCGMRLTVQYSIRGMIDDTSCPANASWTRVDTLLAQGTGKAERGGPFPGTDYSYRGSSGAQTVTVTKIGPFPVSVSANKTAVFPWEDVTFTASVSPAHASRFVSVICWK